MKHTVKGDLKRGYSHVIDPANNKIAITLENIIYFYHVCVCTVVNAENHRGSYFENCTV